MLRFTTDAAWFYEMRSDIITLAVAPSNTQNRAHFFSDIMPSCVKFQYAYLERTDLNRVCVFFIHLGHSYFFIA